MAETPKPALPGQITAPNPFEILWEKNRRLLTGTLVAAAVAIVGFYGARAYGRHQQDQHWAAFSQATELGRDHTEGDSTFEQWRTEQQFAHFWRSMSQKALVDGLPKRLGDLKVDELKKEIEHAKGTEREPYLLWVLANHLRFKADYVGAKEAAERLQREFPKHHLCVSVDWPATYVPVEQEEDQPANPRKPQKTKLPDKGPESASAVGLLIKCIDRDKTFRESHRTLFEAPEPDATPTVTFKLKIGEEQKTIKVRMFAKQAPKLVESFLKRAKAGYFRDQNVHLLRRVASTNPNADTASYFALGNPASKELDRQKWVEGTPKETLTLEESTVSPFAGMLTAPIANTADGRKVNAEVFHVLGSDASLDYEESKSVVFGKVVEGMEVVDSICKEAFLTANESMQGRGIPQKAIQVVSVEVQ